MLTRQEHSQHARRALTAAFHAAIYASGAREDGKPEDARRLETECATAERLAGFHAVAAMLGKPGAPGE